MKLEGKVALVTGAARGIGRAICERYAAEGAWVVVADLDFDGCKHVAASIGDRAMPVMVDVTKQDSIDAMIAAAVTECGGIDILVNNAGVFDMAPLLEITRDSYHRTFAVNVEGSLFTLQAVARQMVQQGRGGKIVNIASQAGRRGASMVAVYCATKAAVISLTQSAGLALAKERINVNAIAPGVIDTPMWEQIDALFAKYENLSQGEKKQQTGRAVPYGRIGVPEDLTGMAVFLASADSDYIVAQTYNVDGGNCMS